MGDFKTEYQNVIAKNNLPLLFIPTKTYDIMHFIAPVKVIKIARGDKFDLVDVTFGNTRKLNQMIVIDNHARRQILTLKRGQYAFAYGIAKRYKRFNDYGYYYVWNYYPYVFSGFYVPRMFDIKKLKEDIASGEETIQTVDLTDKQKEFFDKEVDDILNWDKNDFDEFYKGKKE